MRKRIVIVECYSSAVNYIHDIRELGFEPVLLEQYQTEEEREKVREMNDAAYAFNGDLRPVVIMAKESYEETLEMVRRLMPVLILPGSDPCLLEGSWAKENLDSFLCHTRIGYSGIDPGGYQYGEYRF